PRYGGTGCRALRFLYGVGHGYDPRPLRPPGVPGAARGQHDLSPRALPAEVLARLRLGGRLLRVEYRLRRLDRDVLQRRPREPQHPGRAESLWRLREFRRVPGVFEPVPPDELHGRGVPVPDGFPPLVTTVERAVAQQ